MSTWLRASAVACLMFAGMAGLSLMGMASASAQEVVAEAAQVATEAAPAAAEAAPAADADKGIGYALDNLTLFLCAVLVMFMQAGFAMVEAGLNSAKNTVNILSKNLMDFAVGALLYFFVGFGMMYPALYGGEDLNPYFAFGGSGIYEAGPDRTFSPQVDWFFQVVFAATAATIVSGAVAGRMTFNAYLIYSAFITAIVYPISGYWKWGGGWLTQFEGGMAFQDFAGSGLVHAVGGFAGLAGAILLGPRLGRFTADGRSIPIPGHNITFTALGVFILWFGWYGFNPGSKLAFQGTEAMDSVLMVAVNTTLAAAAGCCAATLMAWMMFGKPDLTMALNGTLGGLVGITAGCDAFSNHWSIAVGAIGGAIVVVGVVLLDKLRIDDPVGAFPVHGMGGVWGCLALGIIPNAHLESGATSFMIQLIGITAISVWSFVMLFALFSVLKAIGILRVKAEHEQAGLDISEHGMHAYPSDAVSGGSIA